MYVLANRYKTLDQIGQGATSTVYQGLDTRLGRDVAIKFLDPGQLSDPTGGGKSGAVEDVAELAEARLAAQVHHQNVVSVFDSGVSSKNEPYIVMELIRGKQLSVLDPTPNQLVQIATDIAAGLAAIHEQGMQHNDLKPENVLITDKGIVKLIDFGVAQSTHHQEDRVGGSVSYIAPERLAGQPASASSDLYSLAALVLSKLTKLPPQNMNSKSASELNAVVLAAQPEFPTGLVSTLVSTVTKSEEHRPQMHELERELRRANRILENDSTEQTARHQAILENVKPSQENVTPQTDKLNHLLSEPTVVFDTDALKAAQISPAEAFATRAGKLLDFSFLKAAGLVLLVTGAIIFGTQISASNDLTQPETTRQATTTTLTQVTLPASLPSTTEEANVDESGDNNPGKYRRRLNEINRILDRANDGKIEDDYEDKLELWVERDQVDEQSAEQAKKLLDDLAKQQEEREKQEQEMRKQEQERREEEQKKQEEQEEDDD